MKKIFIMNLGTTSFKFKLYRDLKGEQEVQASGEIESVGAAMSRYAVEYADGRGEASEIPIRDHGAGFAFFLEVLQRDGILESLGDLDAVGYKAVHGGRLSGTRVVDERLLEEMERMVPLAPAHNSIYLKAMKDIRSKYPKLLQVARFETSFHNTIPDCRTTYGVPWQWREELGIRKYGFHGSSHEYIAGETAQLLPDKKKVISCHLGGSSSICAIRDGESIATTMGATPQSGLFHNNRVGDFEIFCLPMLMEHYGGRLDSVLEVLSKESGLLGLSGVSNDFRLVLDAMDNGDARARLAVETFVDNIVGYIGMFAAYLNGLEALVFTGGIGTNSCRLRQMVCNRLGYLGVALDEQKNSGNQSQFIHAQDSKVAILRLKTDEELVVVRRVSELLEHGENNG